MNPLAALYFAVENDPENKADAVVWAAYGYRHRAFQFPYSSLDRLPQTPVFVLPDLDENRAGVQGSIFSMWENPQIPFDKVAEGLSLWKITIPHNRRRSIRWILHCMGIDRETLFPDLDGLGRYLAWKHGLVHMKDYEDDNEPCL